MSNLRAKLHKENGFTLIEMLIVVAIIAILIAIAIPMVNKVLERAREATDQANERAAVGLAYVAYMTFEPGSDDADEAGISTSGGAAYYVIENNRGRLVKDSGSKPSAGCSYGKGLADLGDEPRARAGLGIRLETVSGGDIVATWE